MEMITMLFAAQGRTLAAFAGHWSLDRQASTSGAGGTLPLSATYAIASSGDSLITSRTGSTLYGNVENRLVIRADGKPVKIAITVFAGAPGGGAPEKVTMDGTAMSHWAHDTLVVDLSGSKHALEYSQTLRWTLSSNGSVLSEARETKSNDNVLPPQHLVYRKAP